MTPLEKLNKKYTERIDKLMDDIKCEFNVELEALKKAELIWPQLGDKYWTISPFGRVIELCWNNFNTDVGCQTIGNFFRTEAEATMQLEALKVITELRNCEGSRPFIVGTPNHCFGVNLNTMSMCCDAWTERDCGWQSIYFESKNTAENALGKVGVQRVINAAYWLAMQKTSDIFYTIHQK